jgi:hypothetical protein
LKEKDNKVNFNISKYFRNIPKFNYTNYNNLKRILEEKKDYNSDSPSLSKKDITFFYLLINDTINELVNEIMGEQSRFMNLALINSMNQLIFKIMPNLKFSVDNIEKKYNSILTEDSLKILHEYLYYQYNEIENMTSNYIKSITENVNSVSNAFKNSKDFFNLVNNLFYNIIMEYSNKINKHILQKKQIINQSSKNRRRTKISNVIPGGEYYEETQTEFDEIEKKIGELYYIVNGKVQILEIDNDEFLKIVDKDFKNNKNNSLINSIGRYVLKNGNNSKPIPASYHANLMPVSFSLPFPLPFLLPIMVNHKFGIDNIDIYLEIGEEYIYDEEDKETPIDMQFYQLFKMNHFSMCESYAGIYIPFIIGNMHIEFGFSGILTKSDTITNIKLNILNNTYSVEMKGNYSYKYDFFLRIGMTIYLLFITIRFDNTLFNTIISGSEYINLCVYNSFRESLLDQNALAAISYFSYSDTDLEQVKKLIEQN